MLEERLSYWQKRLRLTDWLIKVELVPSHQIDGNVGRCTPFRQERIALIQLTTSREQDGVLCEKFPQDLEETLIHELLEIHFDPFKVSEAEDKHQYIAQEAALNLIAYAFTNDPTCQHEKAKYVYVPMPGNAWGPKWKPPLGEINEPRQYIPVLDPIPAPE